MDFLPKPQPADQKQFIDISNNRLLLKYFQEVQLKFMTMNNFGLALDDEAELGQNKPIYLRDLFVAPHLSSQHLVPEQVIDDDDAQNLNTEYQSIIQLMSEQQRLFVLGDPGTGKSTLFNWLMLAFCYFGDNLTKMTLGSLVPFVVVLRDLPLNSVKSWKDLWAIFLTHVPLMAVFKDQEKTIKRLFSSGQALLLIDGLDEITHEATREFLGQAVLEGMNRYPRCRVVISSRIIGFDQSLWFGLKKVSAEDLIADQSLLKSSVKVSDESKDPNALACFYLAPFNYAQAQQFIDHWHQAYQPQLQGQHVQRVPELLTRIKQNNGLGRLARIPVLLNMICFIHARHGRLPDGRAELYQRIAVTYLISLDKARQTKFQGRELAFDYIDLSEWLGKIALLMQQQRTEDQNAILIDRSEVCTILTTELKKRGLVKEKIEEEINFILGYLGQRSGLFIPRGQGENGEEQYAFSHLSFLEFFAARALKLEVEFEGAAYLTRHNIRISQIWWTETFVLFFEQLEQPRLVAEYLKRLFPKSKTLPKKSKIADKLVKQKLLLAQIIMDSGVRLNHQDREAHLTQLWGFYWLLCADKNSSQYYQSFCANLWQSRFNAIKIGIQQAKNSRILYLVGKHINDIKPLADLTQLQNLYLYNTNISDLSPLAALTQLQNLYLYNTNISDLSPLAALTQLQNLYLYNTNISDLSPLAALTQLQVLGLDKKFKGKTQCLTQTKLRIYYK